MLKNLKVPKNSPKKTRAEVGTCSNKTQPQQIQDDPGMLMCESAKNRMGTYSMTVDEVTTDQDIMGVTPIF